MPAAKTPTPSVLEEFNVYRENIPPTAPYDQLLSNAYEAGFRYDLEQVGTEGLADASVLVTFMVHIGKKGEKLEPYRLVTMHLLNSIGPVTLAGRLQVLTTLVHLFFGRLPPTAPEQTIRTETVPDGDITLPGERPLSPEPEDGGEYVPDSAPIDRRAKIMPDLVDHTEPDGVPIFKDLDDMPEQFTDAQIIAQLLEDIDRAAVRFDSIAQLEAMFTKNAPALGPDKEAFLMALGTPEDRTALKAILDRHQARIEAAAAPAREVRIPGGKGSSSSEAGPRRRRAA